MSDADALTRGAATMTVCNACRYCEQYCPVFPAMERRRVFTPGDLAYLANLCHNCGECLHACQYAPPHPFGINVPRVLAEIRLHTYTDVCAPRAAGAAFRHHGPAAGVGLWLLLTALVGAASQFSSGQPPFRPAAPGTTFYDVIPHHAMVSLFGAVSIVVVAVLALGAARLWQQMRERTRAPVSAGTVVRALTRALTLQHLHSGDLDCPSSQEVRGPLRRWFHHVTMYGFLLCFASTTVAAFYHVVLGWRAPYAYTSLPVLLGAAGGLGLLAGPIGLWWVRAHRDPGLGDPKQSGLDSGFAVLLMISSVTGLALLAWRQAPVMGALLVVHLSAVLGLLLSLPYGKFVHGVYRTAALVVNQAEDDEEREARRHPEGA